MILFSTQTFPPAVGGMENLMAGLAQALTAAPPATDAPVAERGPAAGGEAVLVFADGRHGSRAAERAFDASFRGGTLASGGPPGALPASGNPASAVRRFRAPRPLRRLWKARAVAAAAGAGTRAIVCDSWKSAERLPAGLAAPILCLAHGSELMGDQPRRTARIRRALGKAAAVVAVSGFTAGLARARLGPGEAGKVRVIPPGIAPPPPPSRAAQEEIARLVADRSPVLATMARLDPRKGMDMVIRALPELRRAHPRILYLIASLDRDRTLARLARDCGAGDAVRFLAPDSGGYKTALLQAADLFAMPNRAIGDSVEGFGIVFLEAAACGAPALAGRIGGTADAVAEGKTGWLCDGADAAAVTAALAEALSDLPRLARFGDAARRRALEQFSWHRIGGRYRRLIAELRPVSGKAQRL
ncbi:MAG: glycosyltransferase family 4 protein [Gammaproteobacteria bacterium]|nr:glycosyltransferase family 4 protein [Gammaproteobacteria bacterium]